MKINYLKKNYSQDDLRKLINESQKKNIILNKIINRDIYSNMISESYSSLKEKEKYLRKCYRVNNNSNILSNSQNMKIKNFHKIYNPRYYINENEKIYPNKLSQSYINNNINNIINKTLNGEKKHFPLLTNQGSYLKIVNHHLIPNTERLKLIKKDDDKIENKKNNEVFSPTNLKGRLIQRYKDYNKGGIKTYRNRGNINLLRNKMLRNEPFYNGNDYSGNSYILKNKSNIFPKEKHYHPQRYDYKASRFGDDTYNYYLNEPMSVEVRGIDWKFPPLYGYNSKNN